jgi:hypothetical protein
MRSTVSTCPHIGARCYPPMPRGNYRRSCLMAHNVEHYPNHDYYQHVHKWQPIIPPHSPLQLQVNQGSSHSTNP